MESNSVFTGITLEFDLVCGWKEACATLNLVCLLIRCDLSIGFEESFGVTLSFG